MLDLELHIKQKKSLLYKGYCTKIEATIKSKSELQIPVSRLFERIISLAPNLLLYLRNAEVRNENGELVYLVEDIRGRPRESFTKEKLVADSNKRTEEFFYSSGVVFQPPASLANYPDKIENLEQIPFSVEVNSSFDSFSGNKHILHRLTTKRSEMLRSVMGEFDLHMVPKFIPAEVHRIRLGMEYFRERFWGGLAGLMPVSVQNRFFLELDRSAVYLLIEQESGGKRGELPELDGNLLGALDRALDELDLLIGLTERIEARL